MKNEKNAKNKNFKNFSDFYSKFFWSDAPAPFHYPWLDQDVACDVAIIGGGIAGAAAAYYFMNAGFDTLLISNKPIGYGSTASAMGVAGIRPDMGLTGLAAKCGSDIAAKMLSLSQTALENLTQIAGELPADAAFCKKSVLHFTNQEKNIQSLNDEFLALKHNGLTVTKLSEGDAAEQFSFPIKSGFIIEDSAAVLNPYILSAALTNSAADSGARIYENTEVISVTGQCGDYKLNTDLGKTVTCKKIIFTTGISEKHQLSGLCYKKAAYTCVSRPLDSIAGWQDEMPISSCDGVRARVTPDKRIMLSGLDCGISGFASSVIPESMMSDKKTCELTAIMSDMFPGVRNIQPEYTFKHEYLSSYDGLPVIGALNGGDDVYFVLCTGENGIIHAIMAAEMLTDHFGGGTNDDMFLFGMDR